MTTKQVFGSYGSLDFTCGIGAVQVGIGDYPGTPTLINILSQRINGGLECPVSTGCSLRHTVRDYIIHLNDSHRMPRQKIADYLEQLGL